MVVNKFYRWFAALIFLGLIAGGSGGVKASPPASGSNFTVDQTENGLIINWTVPAPEIFTDPDGKVRVLIPGFILGDDPGHYLLPAASKLIGLPIISEPELTILEIDQSTIPLQGELAYAPVPEGVTRNSDGLVIGGDMSLAEKPVEKTYEPVEFEILGVMRGFNLARLTFYPVMPEGDHLRVISNIKFSVNYPAGAPRSLNPSAPSDTLQETLMRKVINPDHLQFSSPGTVGLKSPTPGASAVNGQAIIKVNQRGITKITYAELSSKGMPITIPGNVHMYRSGEKPGDPEQEIALIQDDPNSRFLFYADPRFSRWTDYDTYILQEETSPGLRMGSRSANPSGVPAGSAYVKLDQEQNNIYSPDCYCGSLPLVRGGDRWVWEDIKIPYGGSTSRSYNFNLPTVDTSKPAVLTLWLLGYTDVIDNPDHQVEVRINGNLLSPVITWDGKEAVQQQLTIPASKLIEGTNTLGLSIPGIVDVEGMYLDAYTVEYGLGDAVIQGSLYFEGETTKKAYTIRFREAGDPPNFLAFDVTDPKNPLKLTGVSIQSLYTTVADTSSGGKHAYFFTYTEGIKSPVSIGKKENLTDSNADYVIISHPDFLSTLTPLVNLRRSQGRTVAVFDVFDIYDNYSWGKPLPEGIHAFLSDAYHNWNIPPLYVLLVGDGTSDPKGYDPDSTQTYIPPYLVDVDPWAGETAADNRFVTVDPPGDENDILADMLIGRLPVNSTVEANTVINKIANYETSPPSGDWQKTISFVTDDPDDPDSPINNFPEDALYIDNNFTPAEYDTFHINYPAGGDPNNTRTQIRNRWNTGTAVMLYIGHGAIKRWGKTGEGFWLLDDLSSLTNGAKQPFLFDMTCLTGKFQAYEDPNLAESTLRDFSDKGAAAVWGPTGLGVATGHVQLAEGLFSEIFSGYPTDLGKATLAGKIDLLTDKPYYDDLVDTYVLFGDPATKLQIADLVEKFIYLPLILKP